MTRPEEKMSATQKPRIAVLDIETTGLHAEKAITVVAVVLDTRRRAGKVFRMWTPEGGVDVRAEKSGLRELWRYLSDFDHLITYYGSRFDIPFLRSRSAGLRLRVGRLPAHIDLFYAVRHSLLLERRSLASVSRFLRLRDQKLPFPPGVIGKTEGYFSVSQRRALVRRCRSDVSLTWQVARRLGALLSNGATTHAGRLARLFEQPASGNRQRHLHRRRRSRST